MEMMHHEAGVQTVVVGGRPEPGPMQAPGETRGAQAYNAVDIDVDIDIAETINASTTGLLPDRAEDQAVWISAASFTLRDQIRKGENMPLQFAYEAADCRIFYTFDTVYNYKNLWNYAASAVWSNKTLCVQGSTGFGSNGTSNTQGPPAGSTNVNSNVSHNVSALIGWNDANAGFQPGTPGENDGKSKSKAPGQVGQACTPSVGCLGASCNPTPGCPTQTRCFQYCNNFGGPACSGTCQYTQALGQGYGVGRLQSTFISKKRAGYCVPFSASCSLSTGPNFATEFTTGGPESDSGSQSRNDYIASGTTGDIIVAGMEAWE